MVQKEEGGPSGRLLPFITTPPKAAPYRRRRRLYEGFSARAYFAKRMVSRAIMSSSLVGMTHT